MVASKLPSDHSGFESQISYSESYQTTIISQLIKVKEDFKYDKQIKCKIKIVYRGFMNLYIGDLPIIRITSE